MSIRTRLARRLIPDVHRVAPDLNASVVHQAVKRAIAGVGPLPAAAQAAGKQLEEQDGDVEAAIRELVENHAGMAAAQGFVTNLGGLVTMAAAVPVNITGLALLQCRLVAGIAHLRGYDLADPRVRNAILLCVLGEDQVQSLLKARKIPSTPMAVATAPAYDPQLDALVAAEVTSAMVSRVVGKRAASAVVRRVPVVGGAWGASTDAWATWQIGKYAARELKQRPTHLSAVTG